MLKHVSNPTVLVTTDFQKKIKIETFLKISSYDPQKKETMQRWSKWVNYDRI